MRKILCSLIAVATLCAGAALAENRIGEVSTAFQLFGPNDKVIVERFDDPKVENVSCYVSRAETGGVMGAVGLAQDPSRFSIACRAVGPVKIVGDIKKPEVAFSDKLSFLFKTMKVTRMYDPAKDVVVYLVTSSKAIDGSPFNSISVVPLK